MTTVFHSIDPEFSEPVELTLHPVEGWLWRCPTYGEGWADVPSPTEVDGGYELDGIVYRPA